MSSTDTKVETEPNAKSEPASKTGGITESDAKKLDALRQKRSKVGNTDATSTDGAETSPETTGQTDKPKSASDNAPRPDTAKAGKNPKEGGKPGKTEAVETLKSQPPNGSAQPAPAKPAKGLLGKELERRGFQPGTLSSLGRKAEAQQADAAKTSKSGFPNLSGETRGTAYRRFLVGLNDRFLDHRNAPRERIATGAPFLFAPRHAIPAENRPAPRSIIRAALAALPEPAEGFTFVDLGCGAGRVMFEAAKLPFDKVIGVERDEERYEDAMANFRLWSRSGMRCRNIEIVNSDIMEYELPLSDLVLFMYGMPNRRLVSFIASRVARHAREVPRIYMIVMACDQSVYFDKSPSFTAIEIPFRQRIHISAFSPDPVSIYKAKTTALSV